MDDPPATVAALHSLGFRNVSGIIADAARLAGRAAAGAALAALARADGPGAAHPAGRAGRAARPGRRLRPLRPDAVAPAGRRAAAVDVPAQPGAAGPGGGRARRRAVARRPSRRPCPPRSRACSRRTGSTPTRRAPSPAGCEDARALEDVIAITRALVRAEEFRLCVGQMEGWLDVDAAGAARTALADAALAALLPAVLADHAARYGTVRGGGDGGGGARQGGQPGDDGRLRPRPDADLHAPARRRPRASGRRSPAGQPMVHPRRPRLRRRADRAGRRTGRSTRWTCGCGPPATRARSPCRWPRSGSITQHDAWTWERMALTRGARGRRERRRSRGRTGARHRRGAASVRATRPRPAPTPPACGRRLLRELPPTGPWDVKLRPGGGIEVEFIAQTLLLVTRRARPAARARAVALAHLAADRRRCRRSKRTVLIRADRLWRTVQSMLRILVGPHRRRAAGRRGASRCCAPSARALTSPGCGPPLTRPPPTCARPSSSLVGEIK